MNRFFVKVLLKRVTKLALGTTVLPSRAGAASQDIRILCYHKVSDAKLNQLTVTVADFARQMAHVARNCRVISLADAVEVLRLDGTVRNGAVVITFDDGYRSAFRNALPILKRCGLPATFFITTDYVGSASGLPHDADFHAFDNAVMSWDEIEGLARSGMTIGAHARTHRILKDLEEAALREEIQGSKAILERRLGQRIEFFAYPSGSLGDFDDRCKRIVKDAGFLGACSTINGVNRTSGDLFELRRTTVLNEDNFVIFRYMMRGSLDLLAIKDSDRGHRVVKLLRRLLG